MAVRNECVLQVMLKHNVHVIIRYELCKNHVYISYV